MLVPLETAVLLVAGTLLTLLLALWLLVERPACRLAAVPVLIGSGCRLLRQGQTVQWRCPDRWQYSEARRGSPVAREFPCRPTGLLSEYLL